MVASMIKLLAIVGPTASGKTSLAIELAKEFNGEIICADSRTVYKYLDIGTAKPKPKDQQAIKHWGIDIVDPDKDFTVADFKLYATDKIAEIQQRGCLPIIVGGSGLYIDAVLYDFDLAPTNPELRKKLERKNIDELKNIITKNNFKMPENVKNKRYLIRSIEVGNIVPTKKNLPIEWQIIGLNPGFEKLISNSNNRTAQMLEDGVMNEYSKAAIKYSSSAKGLNGGIYKVLNSNHGTSFTVQDIIEQNLKSDKNLIKKQLTWFKRNKNIVWFDNANDAISWVHKTMIG